MRLFLLLPFFAILLSFNLSGQTQKEFVKNTDTHEHHKNEIGIANSPAYFLNEKIMTYAMHIHYIRTIAETKFGIGVGFERIFLAPKHSTFGLILGYRPIEKFSFTLSPGVTFEDDDPAALFALHLEAAYGFDLGEFHVGPALEFAYDPNDYHLSLGIHVGYGF